MPIRSLLAAAALASVAGAVQAATVFTGIGADAATQRANWLNAVSAAGATFDGLDGLSAPNFETTFGNAFGSFVGGAFSVGTETAGVLSGTVLQSDRRGFSEPRAAFTWTLESPADSFAFNAFDNDGGTIEVRFDDGTAQTFSAPGGGDNTNFFWGLVGASSLVSSVEISTNDGPGVTFYDNFRTATVIPVPMAAPLLATAFGLAAFVRRRSRTA